MTHGCWRRDFNLNYSPIPKMQVECENFTRLDSCERATNIDDAWLQCEQPSVIIT
jgi:hypothetical protein